VIFFTIFANLPPPLSSATWCGPHSPYPSSLRRWYLFPWPYSILWTFPFFFPCHRCVINFSGKTEIERVSFNNVIFWHDWFSGSRNAVVRIVAASSAWLFITCRSSVTNITVSCACQSSFRWSTCISLRPSYVLASLSTTSPLHWLMLQMSPVLVCHSELSWLNCSWCLHTCKSVSIHTSQSFVVCLQLFCYVANSNEICSFIVRLMSKNCENWSFSVFLSFIRYDG